MSRPRVFVVQNPHKRSADGRGMVPVFPTVHKAEEYGDLVFLLSPTARPFNSAPLVDELHEKLRDFNDDDYILLIGNPVLIFLAGGIAAWYNAGRVKALQWNGREERYTVVETDLDFSADGVG